MSIRGSYKKHDPNLIRLVCDTGDIGHALNRGVARTTAYYWLTKAKRTPHLFKGSSYEELAMSEVKKLKRCLEIERAKNQFLSSLAKYVEILKDDKRKVSLKVKKIIILKVGEFLKFCRLKELLKLIHMSESRYYKWRSSLLRCERTKSLDCGVRKVNQLTADEVMRIVKLAEDKRYQHFSLTSLWKEAIIKEIVVCSRDTWFKYINMYSLKRKTFSFKSRTYEKGIRASSVNEIWHIDITELKLVGRNKLYLQVIIDNYSRYVIGWRISVSKTQLDTIELLKSLRSKVSSQNLLMDRGGENIGSEVEKVLLGSHIKRVISRVNTKYSNSMIEAFFKSLKNNFIYYHKYKTRSELEKAVKFYIREHNESIPHSAFDFSTPVEVYKNQFRFSKSDIESIKGVAKVKRRQSNINFIKCSKCLA